MTSETQSELALRGSLGDSRGSRGLRICILNLRTNGAKTHTAYADWPHYGGSRLPPETAPLTAPALDKESHVTHDNAQRSGLTWKRQGRGPRVPAAVAPTQCDIQALCERAAVQWAFDWTHILQPPFSTLAQLPFRRHKKDYEYEYGVSWTLTKPMQGKNTKRSVCVSSKIYWRVTEVHRDPL